MTLFHGLLRWRAREEGGGESSGGPSIGAQPSYIHTY